MKNVVWPATTGAALVVALLAQFQSALMWPFVLALLVALMQDLFQQARKNSKKL